MNNERCETCRFYENHTCTCHKNPPVLIVYTARDGDLEHVWQFPYVELDEWCGQWEKKCDE